MIKTNQYLDLRCTGPLSEYIADYVAQKRALGHKCRSEAQILNQFDAYCIERGLSEATLPQELFDSWCERRPHENGNTQRLRIQQLHMFAKFLTNNGIAAPTVLFPLPKVLKTFVPYIFTHREIANLLAASDSKRPETLYDARSLVPFLMPVLLRMLYCCGLRVGEALKLKAKDVDLKSGIIRLLETKGGRERLVPMAATLKHVCAEYWNTPIIRDFGSEYFFPAPDRLHCAHTTIYERFRECLFSAGIAHGGRGKGPRLHDLRHTYAVHTLNTWAAQGQDIYVALPILKVYLGHTDIKATAQYLRLVPEAYLQITSTFEASFGEVFPEVPYED